MVATAGSVQLLREQCLICAMRLIYTLLIYYALLHLA